MDPNGSSEPSQTNSVSVDNGPSSPVLSTPSKQRGTRASTSHNLSSSSIASSLSRKSRHAEPGTTETHAERASLSMLPPRSRSSAQTPTSIRSPRSSLPQSRRESSNSESWSEEIGLWRGYQQQQQVYYEQQLGGPGPSFPPPVTAPVTSHSYSPRDFAGSEVSDLEEFNTTPRLLASANNTLAESIISNGSYAQQRLHQFLPEPALSVERSSFSDHDFKRMSIGSIHSLASARGVPSSSVSMAGSDNNSVYNSVTGGVNGTGGVSGHRSVSGIMASSGASGGKAGLGAAQPEAGVSNMTVTTGSQGAASGHHQLAPRESHAHHLNDIITGKRGNHNHGAVVTPRSDPTSAPRHNQQQQHQQQNRSRSRAKRRFSGSTGASSHSPGSDRTGPHRSEREEVKPAPLGVIGVCALDVKARSKPSRNILNRMIQNREFDVCVFGDKVILDEEIENWPICDYLISFYSDGFPLDKAIAYVKARKPFCVNDVPMQKILWDRRICLSILDRIGVPTPRRIEVTRDGGPNLLTPEVVKHIKDVSGLAFEPTDPDPAKADALPPSKVELLEDGDVLSVDGKVLKKPFVEKPISGEDHNIIIYFPKSLGGGARKLFRKIGNKSSEFVQDLTVPRAITQPHESFIYEKFMQVDNAEDVKAYTVGPTYCHAETRKSPVVDGVVRRNTHGKEVRYVANLSDEEKEFAARISTAFGQRVCGFDLLRAGGKSYVIDVNGWSFVKDNEEYYNQCAGILKDLFVKERLRRSGLTTPPIPSPAISEVDPMTSRALAAMRERDLANQSKSGPASSSASEKQVLTQETGDARSTPADALSIKSDSGPEPKAGKVEPHAQWNTNPVQMDSTPSTAPSTMPATPSLIPDAVLASTDEQGEATPPPPPPPKHTWKLKGVVSVIRHADRTPKQKYKFTFHTEPFIELLRGHQEEVLLIGEPALASVINAVDIALRAGKEDRGKLKALRNVLVKKGGWAGTKVQIKPMFRKKKQSDGMQTVEEKEATKETSQTPDENRQERRPSASQEYKPHLPPKRHDSLSGVTMSKFTAADDSLQLDKLQLIVKWGGEPTHSARYQAQELGENMRNDFLLLNRDILDEVHVYSSSERRVTTSAQIWAASFLAQKEVPEDFITVRKDLLDDSNAAKDEMDKVKKKLKGLLRKGNERPPQFAWPENMPEPAEVQTRVVQLMNFHRKVMQYNYGKLYSGAVNSLNAITNPSASGEKTDSGNSSSSLASSLSQANAVSSIQARWCCGEDAELFRERWEKLFAEFCDGDKVDPSKISELYDTMKFDALHNRQFLEWVFTPPKHMLEEEYGKDVKVSPPSSTTAKDADESGPSRKGSEDSKSERVGGGNFGEKFEKEGAKAVKRIFRRRSFMNALRHGSEAPPEQYFHLHKGSSPTKAKTDARFEPLRELYQLAKVLFDFICPQEYGISDSEKLEIGLLTSLPLLKEIVQDLEEMQASDEAKSFFYFTKESHIYTLLNCIFEGGIETKIKRATIPELDYLSQICFELYESETKVPVDGIADGIPTFAYSIRITISPGCHVFDPLDVQLDSKHCIGCAPRRSLTPHRDWKEVIETLRARFHQVNLPKSFIAINLSDAFSFPENQQTDESETLEMKPYQHGAPADQEVAAGESTIVADEAGPANAEHSLADSTTADGGTTESIEEQAGNP